MDSEPVSQRWRGLALRRVGLLLGQWHRAEFHVGRLRLFLEIRLYIVICSQLGVLCRRRAASRAPLCWGGAWLVSADMRPSSLGAKFVFIPTTVGAPFLFPTTVGALFLLGSYVSVHVFLWWVLSLRLDETLKALTARTVQLTAARMTVSHSPRGGVFGVGYALMTKRISI